MRTPPNFTNSPTAYLLANQKPTKTPVYYCQFGLVTGPSGTNSQPLPYEYSTGPIQNQTKNRKRIMSIPQGYQSQFNPITYEATLSQTTFSLNDLVEGTRLVTNYTLKNRWVTIYRGFTDIDEKDYTPIYAGQINNWMRTNDLYQFTVIDPLKQLKQTILGGHTQLATDYRRGDNSIAVNSAQGFAPSTDLADGQGGRNYLLIADNIYSYSGVTGGTVRDGSAVWQFLSYSATGGGVAVWFPSTFYTVGSLVVNFGKIYQCVTAGVSTTSGGPATVGQPMSVVLGVRLCTLMSNGSPTDEDHNAGDTVDNLVVFRGNPVDLMLQVMMSTGTGANHGTGTNYDVLPAGQGIGIPWTQFNLQKIEDQRDEYLAGMTFDGYFKDEIQATKWIQNNVLQYVHTFLFTNKTGLIDINCQYAPMGDIDALVLDQTNIVGEPQFNANLQTGGYWYNELYIKFDHQPLPDFYLNEVWDINADSLETYREESEISIESKMIKTIFDGFGIANRCKNIFFTRFSNPPPVITVKTFDSIHLLDPGRVVYLSHPNVPNYQIGRDGGTIICVCINASPDFPTGAVNVTLLAVGYYLKRKYGRITPKSALNGGDFPDFNQATDRQKLCYAFNGSAAVDGQTKMPDLTDGYYVGP